MWGLDKTTFVKLFDFYLVTQSYRLHLRTMYIVQNIHKKHNISCIWLLSWAVCIIILFVDMWVSCVPLGIRVPTYSETTVQNSLAASADIYSK